ncbi:MAG: TRAP transporter substrate-binding protein DctP [Pseudomonadota bacterium]|nr:TRAP transporter substrate-binding protein DctP [Pseudomonadota bacterium]
MRFKRSAFKCGLVLAMLPFAASAQTTTLRVADSLPVGHFFAERGIKFWMAEVRKATNNAVDMQYFPSEQLGKAKDMLQLVTTGVADIAYVVPSYVSDKMPLMTVSELPGMAKSSCQGTQAFMRLVRGGVLDQKEMIPNGVVILFATVLEPYQVYANKAIDSLEGMKGLKLRTAGAAQAATIKAIGGVPVSMAAPETYDSLTRGTIDGVVFPSTSLLAYDLQSRLKSGTTGVSFGTVVLTYTMSQKRFKGFPENVQKAMLAAGDTTARNVCEFLDRSGTDNRAKITAAGVKLFPLSDADAKKLAEASTAAQKEWAAQLDRRGKPGTEVLEAYAHALQ